MGAIAGIIDLEGPPPDRSELGSMTEALRARAPYGWELFRDQRVLLAQARREPSASEDFEGPPVAADAEWDDTGELCSALNLPQDAEVDVRIAAAIHRWGEKAPDRLLGDFAFAAWNRETRSLLVARDPMGVKPLVYAVRGSRLAFASECRALLALPWVDAALNEPRIAAYLAAVFPNRIDTFYRGIQRLPGGHVLIHDAAGTRVRPYWLVGPGEELQLDDDEAYADQFRELLTRSVASRLPTSTRIGLLFSGGLDSSSVHALARQELSRSVDGREVSCLCAQFPSGSAAAESSYIDHFRRMEFPIEEIPMADLSPLGTIESIYRVVDQPFHAPNLYVYWKLACVARERGIQQLLDGVDGDTIIGHGMERLADLFRAGRWIGLIWEARSLGRRFGEHWGRFAWHFGVQPVVGGLLSGRRLSPPSILRPDFARRVGWRDLAEESYDSMPRGILPMRINHWRQMTSALLAQYQEVNDQIASNLGLCARHPFLDRRVVEFCLRLPPTQRMSDGWDRVIQRRAMAPLLPEAVSWRLTKAHWGEEFERRLIDLDGPSLQKTMDGFLQAIGDYVEPTVLAEAWGRCRAGHRQSRDLMNLWTSTTLAHWLLNC